jgi:hypothetical protein
MLLGPQKYMELVATQGAPTDIQKNLIAQGIQPGSPQWNQALGANVFKSGYVPPINATAGATLFDPRTRKPITNAPKNGVQIQYGPNGQPHAVAVPGYSSANASIQGAQTDAQEAAKARHDLVSVPNGHGGSIMMPRSQAVAETGNPQVPGLGVTPSPAQQAFDTATAQGSAKRYNDLQAASLSANGKIASLDRIGQLLKGYQGGSLSNFGMQAGKLANSLGWHDFDPKLPDKEAAVAIGNQLALQLRSTASGGGMPGSMSDADRTFLVASTPNLAQTAEGRQKLIDYEKAVLERQKTVAQMARQWRTKYGRLDAADPSGHSFQSNLQSWADQHPLFSQGSQGYSHMWGG